MEVQKSTVQLKTYTGESIEIMGLVSVMVRYADMEEGLFVYVVHRAGPNLMGRDWISAFEVCLNAKVNHIEPPQEVKEILQSHAVVFTEELGCLKGQEVHLHVQENASPKFCKARPVPFVLRE